MAEGRIESSPIGEQPVTNISGTAIAAAFNRYKDLTAQFQKLPSDIGSRERGLLDGRLSGARVILEAMHQDIHGEAPEVSTTPSTSDVEIKVIAEYSNAYISFLLSRKSQPKIPIWEKLKGKGTFIREIWQRATGRNEGKREELKTFLEALGANQAVGDLEQRLSRLYELNPTEFRRQVREESEIRVSQSLNRLKKVSAEVAADLEKSLESLNGSEEARPK